MTHELERQTTPSESLDMRNSPYTVEGELEGWRRLGRGAAALRGRRRRWALWLAAIILVPMVINLMVWVIDIFFAR
jgi:hypothetical protein